MGDPEKGMTNGIVWDIEIDTDNPAIVYATTEDGVFRSTGSGDEWEKMSQAKEVVGELLGVLDVTDTDQDGYSAVYNLGYYSNTIRAKSHVYLDGVETYQYVYASANSISFIVKDLGGYDGADVTIDYTTPVMIPSYPIRAIVLGPPGTDPVTDRTLYGGTYGKGVYKSTDGGFSWTAKNSGLSDQDVLSLAVDPTDNNTIYAGTQGGGVFKTTDGAENWASSNSGLPASVIPVITIDPNTPSRLYVGTKQDGVYYSTDSGATWTSPTTNVTSTEVTKIVLDSTANPATQIYAATYGNNEDPLGGVYRSSDSGNVWSRLTALDENHVHALGIIPGGTDTLFAGTWGRNLFKSEDGGVTWSTLNGDAPDELTNQIFTTSKVLYSGNTILRVVQAYTTWQGAGGVEYKNDGYSRGVIYNGGSACFWFTVQDANGNPLVGGTTITASVDEGDIAGNISETLPDTQTNTNYYVCWLNDITGEDDLVGTLTITITSDGTTERPGNGSVSYSITRGLIRPVAVSISPSAPTLGSSVTVIPSGGSETVDDIAPATDSHGGYTVTLPDGSKVPCSYGDIVTYTAGAAESVLVCDDVTGECDDVSYTVQ